MTAIVGIWVSDAYARECGDDDPSECIIDELAGQFLACALSPLSLAGFALAFVLFRLFDISKLWPISRWSASAAGPASSATTWWRD